MKNTGVIRKIDELGRIVIPKEIRKNLNIRNGEDVQIYIEEDKIVLKKHKKILSIKENAQRYLNMFKKFIDHEIYITDRESIIASSNGKYLNEGIESKLIALINDRRQDIGYSVIIGKDKLNQNYLLYPIIVDADAVGAILLLNSKEINDRDKVIVEILNSLLSVELY